MATIVLYEQNGSHITRTSDDPDILEDGVYTSAKVEAGVWILYSTKYYSPTNQGEFQLIAAGEGKQPLQLLPKSLRHVKTHNLPGVTMYQHVNYGGWELSTYESLTPVSQGASSVIIGAAVWKLFKKVDYDGSHSTKGPGKYPDPAAMGLPDDTLKSIEKM